LDFILQFMFQWFKFKYSGDTNDMIA